MKILRVFDVSTFIHAGNVNRYSFLTPKLVEEADGFRERRIMTGGISLLWNTLYEHFGDSDMVFCCDRNPTIKQGMYDFYKAGRPHKPEVWKCKRVCEYILQDCGLQVLAEDGYEADDFIHSVVRDKKSVYDHIYIYTADSDLYYLVDDNVTIMPSSSRAKMVTKQNYTYTAGKKDSFTPYNSTTFKKIVWGDPSDNIPGLSERKAQLLMDTFYKDLFFPIMGNKEALTQTLSRYGEDVKAQCELVFPLDVQVPEYFTQGDKIRVAEWGNAVKNKLWRNNNPLPEHIKASIEEMADLGYYMDE